MTLSTTADSPVRAVTASPRAVASTSPLHRPVKISARRLRKSYGSHEALRGVDLTVHQGEIVGILGPNGAGKTTLLEILEGLLPFDGGQVQVLDVDMQLAPHRLRGRINIAMQSTSLPPTLTVAELASLYEAIYPGQAPALQWLDRVGLAHQAGVRINRLSGGQRQRLAVALALAGTPELLLLDEPTSELDPQGRRQVWKSIADDVKAGRRTVVLTTHQMEEAAALCDRVAILDQGQIVAEGRPADLIQTHCPGVTLVFSVSSAMDVGALSLQFPGLEPIDTREGLLFRQPCANLEEAIHYMTEGKRAGTIAADAIVRIEPRTLEDVFLEVTGRQFQAAQS